MAAKQKPQEDLVKLAGRAMAHPEQLTGSEIKRMAARILDDQRNDPDTHEPSLASKVIAKVGDILPDAIKPKAATKPKTPTAPKDVAAAKEPPKPVSKKSSPPAAPAPVEAPKAAVKKAAPAKAKAKTSAK